MSDVASLQNASGGVIFLPEVSVWVHPIDTKAHVTNRPGFRWAVHAGGQPASDLRFCLNAGYAETETEAAILGESHGIAVCKALRMLGTQVSYAVNRLEWDPIPPDVDVQPAEVWETPAEEGLR